MTQSWTYDPDSRVRSHAFTTLASSGALDSARSYDARGKLLSAALSGPVNSLSLRYDGIGGLLTSSMTLGVGGVRHEEYRRDAFGNPLWDGTAGETGNPVPGQSVYAPTGRLTRRDGQLPPGQLLCPLAYPDSLKQTYDAFGSVFSRVHVKYTGGAPGLGCTKVETERNFEFHYYGADTKLRYLQRDAGNPTRTVRTGTFEEHQYDALGRRIRTRERRDSLANQTNQESALTQVLWDGDRILSETRFSSPGDVPGPGNRYGTIGYIHGRELDKPLTLTDGRIPIPDWRGVAQGTVFVAGTPADCQTGQGGSCTALDLPGGKLALTFRGWAGAEPGGVQYTWKGSLLLEGRDGSGLMYKRHRYYDPLTGRFTQEDPIGLAGGLNLYGFANGDPVNFSDPFGLCIPFPECIYAGLDRLRIGVVDAVVGGLSALGELSGMSGLFRGFRGSDEAGRELGGAERALEAGLGLASLFPGGGAGVSGSKAAVRGGLSGLGLSDDLARGVRSVLGSGAGQEWAVRGEGAGAVVNRWVKGRNAVSSTLWTYTLDARGAVVGLAKQVYDARGAIPGTLKVYR